MPPYQVEPGSFRDRTNQVFYQSDMVLRALTAEGVKAWKALSATGFCQRFMAEGKLAKTAWVERESLATQLPTGNWAGVLQHERIPFVSYPYEWPFGMLKDAALLHLDLLLAALDEGMTLKDATPFNCQWVGTRPVFIDLPSFESLAPGQPWVGYRQFCEMFLYPLFLQAYKDIPFQPWLRGCIDGIEAAACRNFFSLYDLLKPGVLTHVVLHARMQRSNVSNSANTMQDLRRAGFHADLIKANARRLRSIVERLQWKRKESTWVNYAANNTYTETEHNAKMAFVDDVVQSRPWQLVWDLGCNTGVFSRLAGANARYVVAFDADQLAIERFYQSLKREHVSHILPLCVNIADASPNLGWRGLERKALTARGAPELTLCLALIHHIVLSANIPLRDFIAWLAELGTDLVIEFVSKDDPMVQSLLQRKKDQDPDYDQECFEAYLARSFIIDRSQSLDSGTRVLYYARSQSSG